LETNEVGVKNCIFE